MFLFGVLCYNSFGNEFEKGDKIRRSFFIKDKKDNNEKNCVIGI